MVGHRQCWRLGALRLGFQVRALPLVSRDLGLGSGSDEGQVLMTNGCRLEGIPRIPPRATRRVRGCKRCNGFNAWTRAAASLDTLSPPAPVPPFAPQSLPPSLSLSLSPLSACGACQRIGCGRRVDHYGASGSTQDGGHEPLPAHPCSRSPQPSTLNPKP